MKTNTASIQPSQLLKQKAIEIGFDYCGVSEARFLEEEAPRLEKWLKEKRHGEMQYMENHFDKRLDPRLLVDGAQSVISLMLNYYPAQRQEQDALPISKYAYGHDYHEVIKQKCKTLLLELEKEYGAIQARCFVDSAPVMDKVWAKNSGLGWVGKNANLIRKGSGSYFFIAEIICDIRFQVDGPVKDYCGTCTRCIDACPTDAIYAPYQIDGSKCISYFTIELKNHIPHDAPADFGNWAFGCDICQDVCPWNRFSTPHQTPAFTPYPEILHWKEKDWLELEEEHFKILFKHSPLKRKKLSGLKNNIHYLQSLRERRAKKLL